MVSDFSNLQDKHRKKSWLSLACDWVLAMLNGDILQVVFESNFNQIYCWLFQSIFNLHDLLFYIMVVDSYEMGLIWNWNICMKLWKRYTCVFVFYAYLFFLYRFMDLSVFCSACRKHQTLYWDSACRKHQCVHMLYMSVGLNVEKIQWLIKRCRLYFQPF